jgi:putative phosphonate metabolism protein
MRAAIYFTPPRDAPLTRLAAAWLGRDAFSDGPTEAPLPLVAEPARYGFHATIKPPFRLAEGRTLEELDEALADFCHRHRRAEIAQLELHRIGRFFALVPGGREPALHALADETVRQFEPFRAPLDAAELARRAPDRLTERQREHLDRWGYPYVFDEFRFHMTLTGPVADEDAAAVEARLRERFAPVIGQSLAIDGLALFVEPRPGGPFRVHTLHSLSSDTATSPT